MPVSPRDFELYSRMTGTPMPSDAMSRMQMAPEVFEFTKNFARKPKGNDRAQAKAIYSGECDIVLMNTYYFALMKFNEENPEQKKC